MPHAIVAWGFLCSREVAMFDVNKFRLALSKWFDRESAMFGLAGMFYCQDRAKRDSLTFAARAVGNLPMKES